MRVGEWIQLGFTCLLALAAWLLPLEVARRIRVTLFAVMATIVIVVARFSAHCISARSSSTLRDWVPAALMLVPYWQVGQFFVTRNAAMEIRLADFDCRFFRWLGIQPAARPISKGLAMYLQLAYFTVYPLVPLALIVLETTGLRNQVDFFWLVVLSATYVSFGLTLFVRALPPRMFPAYKTFQVPPTGIGRLNSDILEHASIQAVTCPSAHVASSLAAALVLLHLRSWVGVIFLWLALSIAVATILGGYHYVADVLLAVAIVFLVFAISIFL